MPATAPRGKGHARTNTVEIQESARLELVIPQASDLDISQAISKTLEDSSKPAATYAGGIPAVATIAQRDSLFYDETLPVFVVLQILIPLEESLYESYLSRLAVSLEVAAVDGQKRQTDYGGKGHEQLHLLFQTVVDEKETQRILLGDDSQRLAIWKLEVPLGHPRARLNNPRVIFTASTTIRPTELQKSVIEDEYITSRQPVGLNLLESFSDDPYLSSIAPRLSASRVSRVIPVTQAPQQALRPFGYASKRSFNIYPAINIRLRYSRIFSGTKQTIIASLDLEVTPFGDCDVTIESVDIALSGGRADALEDISSSTLPIECRPRDDITFLYTLTQTDLLPTSSDPIPIPSNSPVRPISVSLRATAHLSSVCHPKIFTNWTTTVDFSPPPVTPSFPPTPGIQRTHRPPSLGSIIHGATVSSSTGIRPVYQPAQPSPNIAFTPPILSSPSFASFQNQESALGLTITFAGPSRVYVGEVFLWTVFVVNRSQRARKLALIVPPKRRKVGEGKVLPPRPAGDDATESVLDENVVYQTHRAQYLEPAELVPLVNDVRVGPLLPSACHTAELRFIALATGVLNVEGVRVVDLVTNETTDCRDLPSIVSVGKR